MYLPQSIVNTFSLPVAGIGSQYPVVRRAALASRWITTAWAHDSFLLQTKFPRKIRLEYLGT